MFVRYILLFPGGNIANPSVHSHAKGCLHFFKEVERIAVKSFYSIDNSILVEN